jgi:hypothetical protein
LSTDNHVGADILAKLRFSSNKANQRGMEMGIPARKGPNLTTESNSKGISVEKEGTHSTNSSPAKKALEAWRFQSRVSLLDNVVIGTDAEDDIIQE